MKYLLQVYTGSWNTGCCTAEDVIRKIDSVAFRIPVDKVVIGWHPDAGLYQKAGTYLHGAGIRMLLWLPVFSSVPAEAKPDRVCDLSGHPLETDPRLAEEGFSFVCPSSGRNIRIVRDLYEKHFSRCDFDGVFLDRIRTQSFVSGVSGILSCGCRSCREAFRKKGVNTEDVRKLYEEKSDSFFDMLCFPANGQFRLKDPLAQRFFAAKEEIVTNAAAETIRFFKEKGLIVGLDLFAPLISRFVGQNYSLLASHADFIKPMLYRRTAAPAGIGYEYALFEKHAPQALGRPAVSMDASLLCSQLEAVKSFSCEKYPGIELNYDKEIVRTDAGYITESLSAISQYGFEGAALSWNIMQVPEAHIDAAARF